MQGCYGSPSAGVAPAGRDSDVGGQLEASGSESPGDSGPDGSSAEW